MHSTCHETARVVCSAAPDPHALVQRYPILGAVVVVVLVAAVVAVSWIAAARVTV